MNNSNQNDYRSDLPEDRTTVLLLGVTRIPTSPLPNRRPYSLPPNTTLEKADILGEEGGVRQTPRRGSVSDEKKSVVVRRNSSLKKGGGGRRLQVLGMFCVVTVL